MVDEMRDHLDSITRSLPEDHPGAVHAEATLLTIVTHPDPSRIGERAVLQDLGRGTSLSRREPFFAPVNGDPQRPLTDPHLSRRPIQLAFVGGGLVLDTSETKTRLAVNGTPVQGRHELSTEELRAGAVLLIHDRIVLVLRHGEAFEPLALEESKMIGQGAAMSRLRRELDAVAEADMTVLLKGESGTGKELAARAIHRCGPRISEPFLAVNMAEMTSELAPSQLFGAARGSFTGADRDRAGLFQLARRGTLFLDEIGVTPPAVQDMLLRALESREVRPVGAEKHTPFQARVIAATDTDLEEAVAAGRFRAPLLHRLEGYEITLPTLRERREDFGELFVHFLRRELRRQGEEEVLNRGAADRPWVPAPLVERLTLYDWPGNVRQLENVVRQLVVGNRGEESMKTVPKVERLLDGSSLKKATRRSRTIDEVSKEELREALGEHGYVKKYAAEALGIHRASLYKLMKRFGMA